MNVNDEGHSVEIPSDLEGLIEFHGHLCPGLLIGYRAARLALDLLDGERAEDEELFCVVENDSCSVDAVQYLAGCTFGKGNLIFHDYGKQVFTFGIRSKPGRVVRISLKPREFPRGESAATREWRIDYLLRSPDQDLFWKEEVQMELPPAARIFQSVICDKCGEPTMETRVVERSGQKLCIPCSEGWEPVHRSGPG